MKMRQCFVILLSACFLCGTFTGTASASKWGSIIGSILGGSSGSGSGSSADYQPTTVVGKIVDGDQVPLSGIKVTIQSDKGKSWSTHTDANGNYRLNVHGRGTDVSLIIMGEEWRTVRERISLYNETVHNYTLHHDYITGKVTDRYGNPMHWVKLSFEANGGIKGVVTVETDENGNYKAKIPEDGVRYWVVVSQDGYRTFRDQQWLYGGHVENYTLYEE